MSDRRVPRYEDDYSAELPIWPPRDETAVPTSSPVRFEKAGEAPPPASPAFVLSEQSRLLALLVAERGGIAVGEVVERAVVHYAEHIIGIAALARPMILPCDRGESLGADAQAPP